MGLIVDTCVFVDLERRKRRIEEIPLLFAHSPGAEPISISAMTVVELAHGVARAKPARSRQLREKSLQQVVDAFPTVSVDTAIALRAGMLDGELKGRGFSIGLADAIIAATALHLGYSVATLNGKHFKLVPGLDVVEM